MPINSIQQLRNQVIRTSIIKKSNQFIKTKSVWRKKHLYAFLGKSHDDQVNNLALRTLPNNEQTRKDHEKIFSYIVDFWNSSTFSIPYKTPIGKGLNLAKYPFLVPSGEGAFFNEQYRWDTRFQNLGLIIAGGDQLCIGQLLNLVEVYKEYGKIPNALSTEFLTHAQPMLETTSVFDLLDAGIKPGKWSNECIKVSEKELFTEWFDAWEKKKRYRMTLETLFKYGFLSRHVNIHFHPMLTGCEDGKDHNWISAKYGEQYLPVQLNSIIYKVVSDIIRYYTEINKNAEKVKKYKEIQNLIYKSFQKIFWVDSGDWRGFYNYAINLNNGSKKEGPILFEELASDIFPLWSGLASVEQAKIVVAHIQSTFETEFGLITATKDAREGSTFDKREFEGWVFQWDYPNIWPPLMQIAIEGLFRYHYDDLAISYMKRWILLQEDVFEKLGVFLEKYSIDQGEGSEGFYGLEKGFGWTIGTYLWMIHKLDALNISIK